MGRGVSTMTRRGKSGKSGNVRDGMVHGDVAESNRREVLSGIDQEGRVLRVG